MENKNLQQMQLELISKLLRVVNSKEEFNYLKAERENPALSFHIQLKGGALRRCH